MPVFTVTSSSNRQPSKIKGVKEDEYSNSLTKVRVCAMFRAGDIRRNVLLKFTEGFVWRRHVCVPLGTQIWRPEADKNIFYRRDVR